MAGIVENLQRDGMIPKPWTRQSLPRGHMRVPPTPGPTLMMVTNTVRHCRQTHMV